MATIVLCKKLKGCLYSKVVISYLLIVSTLSCDDAYCAKKYE